MFVPGIVAMIRLIFTDVIVAIEGDSEARPMERSREVSSGHCWRIFFALLPLMILEFLLNICQLTDLVLMAKKEYNQPLPVPIHLIIHFQHLLQTWNILADE